MRWLVPFLLATAAILGVGAYLRRRAIFHVLGPVFFYDAVRQARRSRFVLLRVGYAALLVLLLFFAHRQWAERYTATPVGLFERVKVPADAMPELAAAAFSACMSGQFLAIFLLTPIYTAGAIAEEKDRRTLELLFTCGLTSREIVIGKLASRLAHVFAVLIAGLPIVAVLPFFGGVDPNLVLAGYAATVMTAISLGSLGLRLSILANHPFEAVLSTYAAALGYLLVSPCIPGFNAWLRFSTLWGLDDAPSSLKETALLLAVYTCLHGLIAFACIYSSIRVLRSALERREPVADPAWVVARPRRSPPLRYILPRPRPPSRPLRLMLWKETWLEPDLLHRHPVALGCLAIGFVWGGLPLVFFLLTLLMRGWSGEDTNAVIRPMGVAITAPMLFLIGLGTAGRISRERERRTLDSLLTTAVDWRDVLIGKGLASVKAVSYVFGIAGAVWLVGLLGGGLNAITFPLLVLAVAAQVGFAAVLGLYFSATCRSTVHAMIVTVVTLLALYILPLFLGDLIILLSPPAALWQLSMGYDYTFDDISRVMVAFGASGPGCALSAMILARSTRRALEG